MFNGLGATEFIIIAVFILVFFGAKRIPELARGLGQGIKEFRQASKDIKREIEESSKDIEDAINTEEKRKQLNNTNRALIPKTIQETRSQILDGKLTLPDVVEHYFRQISEKNAEINAFVYQDRDDALAQATRIQKKIASGEPGRLLGAIMGIKDVICESGKPTTCASKMLSNFESVYDATVIEKLKSEDAILNRSPEYG